MRSLRAERLAEGPELLLERMTGAPVKLAKAVLLVLSDWVAQHVAGGVGGYEFPT